MQHILTHEAYAQIPARNGERNGKAIISHLLRASSGPKSHAIMVTCSFPLLHNPIQDVYTPDRASSRTEALFYNHIGYTSVVQRFKTNSLWRSAVPLTVQTFDESSVLVQESSSFTAEVTNSFSRCLFERFQRLELLQDCVAMLALEETRKNIGSLDSEIMRALYLFSNNRFEQVAAKEQLIQPLYDLLGQSPLAVLRETETDTIDSDEIAQYLSTKIEVKNMQQFGDWG